MRAALTGWTVAQPNHGIADTHRGAVAWAALAIGRWQLGWQVWLVEVWPTPPQPGASAAELDPPGVCLLVQTAMVGVFVSVGQYSWMRFWL